MDIEKCGTCEWCRLNPLDENNIAKRTYSCKRSPPQVSFVPISNGHQMGMAMQTAYPVVMKDAEGCGEYTSNIDIIN